jgi:hypothetical protein
MFKFLILLSFLCSQLSFAQSEQVDEVKSLFIKKIYSYNFKSTTSNKNLMKTPSHDFFRSNSNKAFRALWELKLDNRSFELDFTATDIGVDFSAMTKALVLSHIKSVKLNSSSVLSSVIKTIETRALNQSEASIIVAYKNYLPKVVFEKAKVNNQNIKDIEKALSTNSIVGEELARDLFDFTPDLEEQHNLRVFVFCRENRDYPCRLVIKSKLNEIVKKENGEIWSMPVLAKSSRGLPSNITNGNTPMGIHLIKSVMPQANRQRFFGKFRRVILNFIPNSSEQELETKSFLPASQHGLTWWKRASIARDVGRKYLRIHGTSLISKRSKLYYPHMASSGCLTTLEGEYDGVKYIDQREVLDAMMNALGLATTYKNEVKLKGLFHLLQLDNKKGAVALSDLDFLL